jgi:4-oxalmesaconate hydratase
VIIDIHGHYTTAPTAQQRFRADQLAALDDPALAPPDRPRISDDEIRESIELNQLRILRGRGGDLMLFSPKASGMEHHVKDRPTATQWAMASNDLVHRVTELFPDAFAPVAQLPQTPNSALSAATSTPTLPPATGRRRR